MMTTRMMETPQGMTETRMTETKKGKACQSPQEEEPKTLVATGRIEEEPKEMRENKMATEADFLSKEEASSSYQGMTTNEVNSEIRISSFTEDVHDGSLHFQIICLQKQIYVWIGYNSAKLGHLYAAAPTRPNSSVSVTSLLGGGADNCGSSIARHLVRMTGFSVVLACHLPKDSPMLEANAERILVGRMKDMGLIISKS